MIAAAFVVFVHDEIYIFVVHITPLARPWFA